MTQTVLVHGKPHDVEVYQKSKTVWIAVGDCMGERLETKDSSSGAALKRWKEAAEYKGNGQPHDLAVSHARERGDQARKRMPHPTMVPASFVAGLAFTSTSKNAPFSSSTHHIMSNGSCVNYPAASLPFVNVTCLTCFKP